METAPRHISLVHWLAPALLGGALLAVYLATLAPGLTWAHGGADGGDLIAAAVTGGVAHPSGYPVYLLLAGLFSLLRIGTPALRMNLLSALCMSGAALLVFGTVRRALAAMQPGPRTLAALVAGLAFGLSPLAWSQAVITEVHALHMLLMAALLYLAVTWTVFTPLRAAALGLILGLAMGNHGLSVLMLPAVVLVVSWPRVGSAEKASAITKGRRWDWRAFGLVGAGILAGLLSYLILPVRAAAHPAVNWGDPVTVDRFLWLVSGQLYHGYFTPLNGALIAQHAQGWAGLALQQFGLAGLVLAVLGTTVFISPSPIYFLTVWMAVAFTLFALQYDVADWEVYLLPVFLSFAIWLGMALGQIATMAAGRSAVAPLIIGVVCVAYLGLRTLANWPQVDASRDTRAEDYGRAVMAAAPKNAVLFAQGDQAVFGLWYFQYALHDRPDLVLVANDLLPFEWYRSNLEYTYPKLVLPAATDLPWMAAIRQANPDRHVCYVDDEELVLSCP